MNVYITQSVDIYGRLTKVPLLLYYSTTNTMYYTTYIKRNETENIDYQYNDVKLGFFFFSIIGVINRDRTKKKLSSISLVQGIS